MIKIICFAALPVLTVLFYPQPPLEPEEARAAEVRLQDRLFLAALDARETTSTQRLERADREFLAVLQQNDPIPNALPTKPAIAIRSPLPAQGGTSAEEDGIPVRRAVPVARAVPVRAAIRVRAAEMPAMPIASNTRAPLPGLAIRKIESSVHQAPPLSGSRRASILIYRGEVTMTPVARVR